MVVQVNLSRQPKSAKYDLVGMLVENLGNILHPFTFSVALVLHAPQTRYCFGFREIPMDSIGAGGIRRHLVDSMNNTLCGGYIFWENDMPPTYLMEECL